MLSPNPIGWFELAVSDMQRARLFYHNVFAFEFELLEMGEDLMAMFPFDHTKPGCSGALVQGGNYVPGNTGTMMYFECSDVAPYLAKVEQAGGQLLLSKTSIGPHGFIGIFLDSEGNKVGMHSPQQPI